MTTAETATTALPFLGSLLIPCIIGFISTIPFTFLFEHILRQPWAKKYYIQYNGKERWDDKTNKLPPTAHDDHDLRDAIIHMATVSTVGPIGLHCLGMRNFEWESVSDLSSLTPASFILQLSAYLVVLDFITWTFHYACHHNDFLWKHVHSGHHRVHTPTALSATVGDVLDPLVIGTSPHLVTILILHPHALVMYVGMTMYTIASIHNHSGMNMPALSLLLGGWIPFRASPVLHDRHHKFSARKCTDMGFVFWIWDWLVGTLTPETLRTCGQFPARDMIAATQQQ